MKKTTALFLTAALLLSLLALAAGAEGYKPTQSNTCDIEFFVPRANPEDVIKDGRVGDNEYKKLSLDLTVDHSPLYLIFGSNADGFGNALSTLSTMEYYFSWDAEHGLNIAVRYAPPDVTQTLYVKENSPYPEDNFLSNTGFGFAFHDSQRPNSVRDNLYYAVAKRTDNGEYLIGWWLERGISGKYSPKPEQDFIIEYEPDGHVICEWSVPFSEIIKAEPAVGRKIYLSVTATSGTSTYPDIPSTYGVSLGDRGYLVPQNNSSEHAVAILSGESVDGSYSWTPPFEDIEEGDWYYDAVKFVSERALMVGKSDNEFSPNVQMTRAELVTVLWRMEGSPASLSGQLFEDVKLDSWYFDAVMWAYGKGIVKGYDGNIFCPDEPVTREQLATIIHRYDTAIGEGESEATSPLTHPDAADVQSWAVEAVSWAVSAGIITGKPSGDATVLAPQAHTTRAELATILMRYSSMGR